MALLAALLLSFVPGFIYATIAYQIDRYEKEPKRLIVGVFLWGDRSGNRRDHRTSDFWYRRRRAHRV